MNGTTLRLTRKDKVEQHVSSENIARDITEESNRAPPHASADGFCSSPILMHFSSTSVRSHSSSDAGRRQTAIEGTNHRTMANTRNRDLSGVAETRVQKRLLVLDILTGSSGGEQPGRVGLPGRRPSKRN